jgi:hypothetical protein
MIKVYTANRPPLKEYENLDRMSLVEKGEIHRIALETGNHWRKVFNVYAKFMYSFAAKNNDASVLQYKTWQLYRDGMLLQASSNTQLHFNYPGLRQALSITDPESIRIVMGKAFAESLLANVELTWLDKDFAINKTLAVIVCPYFDYRQLSNAKIETLIGLVLSLQVN